MSTTFAPLLLRAAPFPARALLTRHAPALEALLQRRWDEARHAWPGVIIEPCVFWPYVGERVPADIPDLAELDAMRFEALYLTCACVHRDVAAQALLESHYFSGVAASLSRMQLDAARIDELKQRLRAQLFLDGNGRPAIAKYGGRGDLGSWLRVLAVREGLRLLHSERAEPLAEDERLAELSTSDGSHELRYLKGVYRPLFRDAFCHALAMLGPREKILIRQHYLDGLTMEQVGALHGTHRVTAARWLAAVRQHLLDHTRRAIMERVRVSQAECDSILRLVQSQFDLTLSGVLRDAE